MSDPYSPVPASPKVRRVERLTGWGRFPSAPAQLLRPERRRLLRPTGTSSLARGLGRSYGDAALNSSGIAVLTERLDRFLGFDEESGVLVAEAGASLEDVIATFLPRGWFLPVTPGTRFCTLGGCLAADVHGKNHHRAGTFSAHVPSFDLVLADGSTIWCTPEENPGLFWATAGGMGLTGFVATLALRLRRVETSWMRVRHVAASSLEALADLLADPGQDAEYSVAWIDCLKRGPGLGRGVFMAGEHALPDEVPSGRPRLEWAPARAKTLPFDLPSFALSPPAVRTFNAVYAWAQGRRGEFACPIEPYFYPLDKVRGWNRMYGRKGFLQYQFVVPAEGAAALTRRVLEVLAAEGLGSFLAVLKRFGPAGPGMLSFPLEGLTLALDIPVRPGLFEVLDRLDGMVADAGGRVYLAKDARLARETFERMYPRVSEFRELKASVDPQGRLGSDLGRRLGLCP
jgi:decaprenylphospho-beta-D-ribofuranose 2-oxidase